MATTADKVCSIFKKKLTMPDLNLTSASTQPTNNGQITYVSGTGFRMRAEGTVYTIPTSTGAATAYDDIGDPDANSTIAFTTYTNIWTSTVDTGEVFTITANSLTTGKGIAMTADALTTGTMLYLDSDGLASTAKYIDCYDGAATDFSVGINGATTIAGTATGTAALTLTAGDITMTSGDVDIAADNRRVSWGASGDTDSYITFNGTNLVFYDSSFGSAVTLSSLAGSSITGDLTVSNGQFIWTDNTAEQAATWTFAGTTQTDIAWASSVTTGKCLSITGNAVTSGDMIYLESTVAGWTTGNYIRCYDGAANDFTVGQYGAVTVAGNASTNVLTVTAGDVQVDAGRVEIDTTDDESSYVKRNQAVTTTPVFEVEETAAAADSPAILIDQNATAAGSYGLEIDSEGGTNIHFAAMIAAGDGVLADVADSYTGQVFVADLGPWLGTAGEGAVLDAFSDSAATVPAGRFLRFRQQGTGQHASAIDGSMIYVSDAAAAPGAGTSYAVTINPTNIGALHVDAGGTQLDGTLTVGVNDTGADVKFFGATAAKFAVWDESADDLILADAVALQLGGDESTADGFKLEFDGTATLALDALTANDSFIIGATTNTDVSLQGATASADINWDASGDSLNVLTGAKVIFAQDNANGIGLRVPVKTLTGTPGTTGTIVGDMVYNQADNKIMIYDGAGWLSVTLT